MLFPLLLPGYHQYKGRSRGAALRTGVGRVLVAVDVTVVVADVNTQLQALLILAVWTILFAEVQAVDAWTLKGVVPARLLI